MKYAAKYLEYTLAGFSWFILVFDCDLFKIVQSLPGSPRTYRETWLTNREIKIRGVARWAEQILQQTDAVWIGSD